VLYSPQMYLFGPCSLLQHARRLHSHGECLKSTAESVGTPFFEATSYCRTRLVHQELGNQKIPNTQHLQKKVHSSGGIESHTSINKFVGYRSSSHGLWSGRNVPPFCGVNHYISLKYLWMLVRSRDYGTIWGGLHCCGAKGYGSWM
jgi:hypothetical protein